MAKRSLERKNEEKEERQEEAEDEEEVAAEEQEETEDDDDVEYGGDDDGDGVLEDRRKRVMIRVVSSRQNRGVSSASCSDTLCCQADDCGMDLRVAKRYHRRHKVCKRHAKATVVLVGGIHQRFCQQCSRFHEVSQFDDTKRSCRKRLAGHNERRRKTHLDLEAEVEQNPPPSKMNHCSLKDTGRPEYGEMTLRGSSNIKHFRIR